MVQPFHQQPNLPVVRDVHDPLLALDLLAAPRLERYEVVDLGQGARPPGDLAVHQLDQHHLDSDFDWQHLIYSLHNEVDIGF